MMTVSVVIPVVVVTVNVVTAAVRCITMMITIAIIIIIDRVAGRVEELVTDKAATGWACAVAALQQRIHPFRRTCQAGRVNVQAFPNLPARGMPIRTSETLQGMHTQTHEIYARALVCVCSR